MKELAGRVAYNKKLTYREMDAAMAAVSAKLPLVPKSVAKRGT